MDWKCAGICAVIILTIISTGIAQDGPVWTYKCENNMCEKLLLIDGEEPQSINVCKIMCDAYAMLWPRPTSFQGLSKTLVRIDPQQVTVTGVDLSGPAVDLLDKASVRFSSQLSALAEQGDYVSNEEDNSLNVYIVIRDPSVVRVALDTAEGYTLTINLRAKEVGAFITADTFFGARHALETITQLCISDEVSTSLLILVDVEIFDRPVFTYRGINLDTSRNFYSVDSIKRTIDGMALNKLNTFHWHMTDSHSWPFVSESYPQLSRYGAYSTKQVYTAADIRDIVAFGHVRGVRVIPELDAPAHVGNGFQFADPGTVVCYKAQPWTQYCVEPPCGQFNPTNEQVYDILGGVYTDMLNVFESDIFHMGGDEVNLNCWNTSTAVTDNMQALGFPRTEEGFYEMWQMFQNRAYDLVVEANGGKKMPAMLWTNSLTQLGQVDKYLDNDTYIIQIWTEADDPLMAELVNKGFRVVFTNYDALYLDCGVGGWVTGGNNWCSPYKGWDRVYNNNPYELLMALNVSLETAKSMTLGSEASLWSEQADESSLDSKLWPRLAALAERLWTNPQEGWQAAESRMLNHRERLQGHGLHPEMLQPEWCIQNQGYCPIVFKNQEPDYVIIPV